MKTLYSVNWDTLEIETAVLLDEHNMNDGASVETWLCKGKNGRKFTCSKFDLGWRFSELEAWQEFEAEMGSTVESGWRELEKMQKAQEEAEKILATAQQKISELTTKQ